MLYLYNYNNNLMSKKRSNKIQVNSLKQDYDILSETKKNDIGNI